MILGEKNLGNKYDASVVASRYYHTLPKTCFSDWKPCNAMLSGNCFIIL